MSGILERSFKLMEHLAAHPEGRALSALAAELGLPLSATHRLLTELARCGYVRQDQSHGDYMLTIEGKCALGNDDPSWALTVICKVGPDEYKKHFLGLSDNVTYFVEQLDGANVSRYHYEVVFKPSTIIPDIEIP